MAIAPKLYQILVGIFASLGAFLYGYDLTIVAEVVSSQSFLDKFNPSTAEVGLIPSLLTAGAFFGAAVAGLISDRLGRRWTIVVGGATFCIGAAFQTGGYDYAMVVAGRFISGLGIGTLVMIVPLYQAELVHPDIRGFVTGLVQFMLGIGGVAGSWLSYGTYVSYSDDRQWRIPLGVQIVPALAITLLIFAFPESPRWLIAKGKDQAGLETLARLHANGDTHDPFVVAEFEQIQAQLMFEQEHQARSWKDLFSTKSSVRRIVLACAIQAATQMTGVSAIQYYSVDIFKQIGISGRDTLKWQAVNSIIGLAGELCSMLLVDRVGRRMLIINGNLAMSVTFIVGTILLAKFPAAVQNSSAHWAFIVMTWLFNFAFGSMGSLSWILPAEIFDTKTRSYGVAIATMTSFAFNTMIGQCTNVGLTSAGWRFYILFVVANVTNALFFWAFLPETSQLPLEEMDNLFTTSPLFIGWKRESSYRSTRESTALSTAVRDVEAEQTEKMTHLATHVESSDPA